MDRRKKACVIGDPVAHSRSPLIHGYWLKTFGLDGAYERAHVRGDDFARFLRAMPDEGYAGGNVTVPHKEKLFALAHELTDRARAVGAANTVWFESGKICADNTDALGFISHLDASHPDWTKNSIRAVILGAGGAARGVLHALIERGAENVTLVNRHVERAEALAAAAKGRAQARGWNEIPDALRGANLLVNTTSLGMQRQPALDCPLDGLADDAIVDDIVYIPLETDLLKRAKARGLRTVDGLGMLLHQAVPGFSRWFGKMPEVTAELRAILEADIVKAA
ncbi:shikimate dehydrogenase [Terrirubrum flagellatum]|uniref:shikimate dehydrogenase n=1 Tax=Terrirubrum flagellatum TaxID=2895980 RepID=UPI003CC83660